jgi:hypothetical protein
MTIISRERMKFLGLLGLAAIAAAWVLLAVGSGDGSAVAQAPTPALTATAESQALTASAAPGALGGDTVLSAGSAQEEAAALATKVPLPAGADFGGIVWSDATALGPISEADVEGYLEFNAACKWWSVAYANGGNPVAAKVVQDIPQWPTFREGDRHALATGVATDENALLNAALACDLASRHARAVISQRGHQ